MKRLRFVAFLLAGLLAAAVAIVIFALTNQARIQQYIVSEVRARSRLELRVSGARLVLASHPGLVLDNPQVFDGATELARARRIVIFAGYHALVQRRALPLSSVEIDYPEVKLPLSQGAAWGSALQPDEDAVHALQDGFRRMGLVTRRLKIVEAQITSRDGEPLADNVSLLADRRFRGQVWHVLANGTCRMQGATGLKAAADFRLGTVEREAPGTAAHGSLWLWNDEPRSVALGSMSARGMFKSQFGIDLKNDGRVLVDAELVPRMQVTLPPLKSPLTLQSYRLDARLNVSGGRIELSQVRLMHGSEIEIAGDGYLSEINAGDPRFGLRVGGIEIAMPNLQSQLANLKGLPQWFSSAQIAAGNLVVGELGLDSSFSELRGPLEKLLPHSKLDVRLSGLKIVPAAELALPTVEGAEIKFALTQGVLTGKGQARVGRSRLHDVEVKADLTRGPGSVNYEISADADLDVAEISTPAARILADSGIDLHRWVGSVKGDADLTLEAKGSIDASGAKVTDYEVNIEPHQVSTEVKALDQSVSFARGVVTLRPGSIALNKLEVEPAHGKVTVTGSLGVSADKVDLREMTADLQGILAQNWLPLFNPDGLSAEGPMRGTVNVKPGPNKPGTYVVRGKVTVGPGQVQLGFLRSPIIIQAATLDLDGRGIRLAMPHSRLEGKGLNFTLSEPDFSKPSMRIDAVVEDLDLEVMKFVRLPWSPKTEVSFPHIHATGHIEAAKGNLAKLQMTNLSTDFVRDGGNWRVYNYSADVFSGKVTLELTGRAADNWIRMKGHISDQDVGEIFRLARPDSAPMMTGKLYADVDVWGDTDVDFFKSLAGTGTAIVKDGTVNKFKVLSRMLNTIDLKNWLTKGVPDPRLSGVPFESVTTDFAGEKGMFYSDNVLLLGPVLDITAGGNVDLGDTALDMQVGMFPFQTVNWVLNKIPIIGEGLSSGIVAAYFHVHGPLSDPSVTPAPLTSVAEIIKRTLGLPINMIRPNTIR